jgi:hypothetical protein
MAKLVYRVGQVENLYAEKLSCKKAVRREKVAYLDVKNSIESCPSFDKDESEVHVAELKPRLPYVCKALNPNNSKENS